MWSPFLKQDIDNIEKVQRHFTKRIDGLYNLSYHDRLKVLKLPSLEYRRMRGDLIETYKIVRGMYDVSTTGQSRWRSGSVSASKSKGPWFKPGPVQDFSHISDLLGLSGWLSVIGTECGLWIGTSS